jgi:hypothetical protein
MRQFVVICLLIVGGVLAWRLGEALSSDAISMGLGIFFGMIAGLPAALVVLAASRRRDSYDDDRGSGRRSADSPYGNYGGQPPVIVVTAPGMLPQGTGDPRLAQPPMELPLWTSARPARQFKVVGEREELVDEWA